VVFSTKPWPCFLGQWRAEGKSYGSPNQLADDPKSASEPWISKHTGTWHPGEYFLIQDEKATTGANSLDTLSVMGVDPGTVDTSRTVSRTMASIVATTSRRTGESGH